MKKHPCCRAKNEFFWEAVFILELNISVTENNIIYDIILFYHIIYGNIQGFPALRKAITKHIKKICIFSRVFDITNQLLTHHLPFGLLAQVGE